MSFDAKNRQSHDEKSCGSQEVSIAARWRQWCRRNGLLLAHFAISAAALTMDLLGDRSFGALMLSTLPVALIAVASLLVGPWLNGERQKLALRGWLVGASLVAMISLAFASLGSEQAKTGELIFTYAALLMSFPFSLLMPVVMTLAERWVPDDVVLRVAATWAVCTLAGCIGWSTVRWLRSKVRKSEAGQPRRH